MDSIRNTQSTANELLGSFGIWITTATHDQVLSSNQTDNNSQIPIGNITAPYLIITGGNQLLTNIKNEVYASMTEFGNTIPSEAGKLVVIVDSYTFSDAIMGGTFAEPTQRQRRIYDTEFYLFNEILLP